MRSEREVNTAVERYGDTVQRLCLIRLKIMPIPRIFFRPSF